MLRNRRFFIEHIYLFIRVSSMSSHIWITWINIKRIRLANLAQNSQGKFKDRLPLLSFNILKSVSVCSLYSDLCSSFLLALSSFFFAWIKTSIRINTRFRTWIGILLINNTEFQLKNAVFVTSIRQLYVNKVLIYLFRTAKVQHLVCFSFFFFNPRTLSVRTLRHVCFYWSFLIPEDFYFTIFSKS